MPLNKRLLGLPAGSDSWPVKQRKPVQITHMKIPIKLSQIIRFWGLCDIAFMAWYLTVNIIKAHIPFFYDMSGAIHNVSRFEAPMFIIFPVLGLFLYISIAFSGFLFYRQRKAAAIICYIQTPFRWILVCPSLFFIFWPFKYLFDKPPVIGGIVLIITTELFKLVSVIFWYLNKKLPFIN